MPDRLKYFIKISLGILSLLVLLSPAKAQGYYFYDASHFEPSWVLELSANIGGMNGVTDIGGSKKGKQGLGSYTFRSTKPGGGLTLSATHRDIIAFRLDLVAGNVEGHDSLLKGATNYNAVGRYERNLNFRSSIFQVFAAAEFHPLYLRNYQINDRYVPRLSPYITAGIGFANFTPKVLVEGNWIPVQPLRLEGQGFEEYPDREPYSTSTLTLPVGAGLRYEASRALTLRLEFINSFTRTDYLDDVSKGDWVDPSLFYKYLSSGEATLASMLYNRSIIVNPPRNTRPRGDDSKNDIFWTLQFRVGLALNRGRF
jgi:opacity protein-like surface antigen